MADNKPIDPMTDEAIDGMVLFIESVELFAKTMNMTTGQGARMMLKSMQIFQSLQQRSSHDFVFKDLFTTKVQ